MHGVLELVNIEARSKSLTHRSVLTGQVSGYFLLLIEILYFPLMSTTTRHIHNDKYPAAEEQCAP
jgi:hypothetical protein